MHIDHKIGTQWGQPSGLSRTAMAAISALVAAIPLPVAYAEPQSSETAVTCTNTVSGASWQIRIDYRRSTVDSNPARIGDSEISWRGAEGWYYRLDRKSGSLEVILASATGGNFFHHHCKLEN